MRRREFSRGFKLEAVKLLRERGVSVSQAARDLAPHENVLRKWVGEQAGDPGSAFPGHGVMKPEQQEIERLCRYIERFYSPTRRHSTLGYLSPMDFERQAQVA